MPYLFVLGFPALTTNNEKEWTDRGECSYLFTPFTVIKQFYMNFLTSKMHKCKTHSHIKHNIITSVALMTLDHMSYRQDRDLRPTRLTFSRVDDSEHL